MVQRLPAEVGEPLHRDQPAFPHDADALGDALDVAEDVGGEEDGAASPGVLAQQRVELPLDEGVEPARRLVEDEEVRLGHEREDHGQLPAVAAREGADAPREVESEPLGHSLRPGPVGPAPEMAEVVDVL
ncbi:hypothetical protein J2W20_001174 [Sinomonas atrocyanea]|nr:hypothetical protein [Sinomonas atrocyanea]